MNNEYDEEEPRERVNKLFQLVGQAVQITSLGLALSTVVPHSSKQWRAMDMGGEAVEAVQKYDGLFVRCTMYPTGQEECESIDDDNQPEYTTVCRILMYLLLGNYGLGVIAYYIGSAHTACLFNQKDSDIIKARWMIGSGITFLFGGILGAVAAILYTIGVNGSSNSAYLMQHNTQNMGGNYGNYGVGDAITYLWLSVISAWLYTALCFLSSLSTAKQKTYKAMKEDDAYDVKRGYQVEYPPTEPIYRKDIPKNIYDRDEDYV